MNIVSLSKILRRLFAVQVPLLTVWSCPGLCIADPVHDESSRAVSKFTWPIPNVGSSESFGLLASSWDILKTSSIGALLERNECEIKLSESKPFANVVTAHYRLWCAGVAVENIELTINSSLSRTGPMWGILPTAPLELLVEEIENVQHAKFLFAETFAEQFSDFHIGSHGLCPTARGIEGCWNGYGRGKSDSILRRLLIASVDGRILAEDDLDFDLASVYENGPQDTGLITADLPNLGDSGYLDGSFFSVFAPALTNERVHSIGKNFEFSPEENSFEFDQVQSYYGASVARAWFVDSFGFNDAETKLTIHVHDTIFGSTNNASYEPDTGLGPQIRLGAGDGKKLRNISRDGDVIAHEFSHHIIYQRLKTSRGESGLIHEGFADYFAYAMRNDPNLGETVRIGQPYLRTAALDANLRFDDPNLHWPPHERAQFMSAVLWTAREEIGPDMDAVVYHSIDYLAANSGLKDAFFALLSADADLYPIVDEDVAAGSFGLHKCEILHAAIGRGFSTFLEGVDGASCQLDLDQLAADSRQFSLERGIESEKSAHEPLKMFAGACGVMGTMPDVGDGGTLRFLLLILPLIFFIPLSGV